LTTTIITFTDYCHDCHNKSKIKPKEEIDPQVNVSPYITPAIQRSATEPVNILGGEL